MADALKKNVLFGRIMLGECVLRALVGSSYALTKSATLTSVECFKLRGLEPGASKWVQGLGSGPLEQRLP